VILFFKLNIPRSQLIFLQFTLKISLAAFWHLLDDMLCIWACHLFIGMDVHKESIEIAIAEDDNQEVRGYA